jgi:hypothetical protein
MADQLMCCDSGTLTPGFGMDDKDKVRAISNLATKQKPHSGFWHIYVISFIRTDIGRLLTARGKIEQWGQRKPIFLIKYSLFN